MPPLNLNLIKFKIVCFTQYLKKNVFPIVTNNSFALRDIFCPCLLTIIILSYFLTLILKFSLASMCKTIVNQKYSFINLFIQLLFKYLIKYVSTFFQMLRIIKNVSSSISHKKTLSLRNYETSKWREFEKTLQHEYASLKST